MTQNTGFSCSPRASEAVLCPCPANPLLPVVSLLLERVGCGASLQPRHQPHVAAEHLKWLVQLKYKVFNSVQFEV